MNETYTEQLIKRKTPMKEKLLLGVLIFITFLLLIYGVMNPVFMIAAIILIVIDVIWFRSMNVEYEYLFINGSLDIDKIMSKSRRKHIFEMDMSELEIMAPEGNPELRQYQGLKKNDYSSGMLGSKAYEMIIIKNGAKKKIVFEPKENIVEGMWMKAPRKVVK